MAESKWYQTSFRRNLVDMHIEDWDAAFLSEFDPHNYLDCLKMAHIQSPMIYLQSHVGLCNWNTKSGRTHRAFADNNKIKTLIDLCHNEGMDVIAYYSLIYNNWAYEHHPEWRMVNRAGNGSRAPGKDGVWGGRYGLVCPNNAEYRRFIVEQYKELSTVYDFEAIFLDMTFWPMVCYCDSCRARYRHEHGRELPTTVDWHDADWLRFQHAREDWLGEFAHFATREIKNCKPGVDVEHQYSGMTASWLRGVGAENGRASDYAGGDLYGGHLEESYICKLYREASTNQPFEYMTSRCDPALAVHTTTKSAWELEVHNALALAHHGAFLVIDAIDPVGTINPAVYRRIGDMFEKTMPYEPYLTGTMLTEAALYFSYSSKLDANSPPNDVLAADTQANPQLNAQLGAARALLDRHIPFTVIPSDHSDRLANAKLALVTEACLLDDSELDNLVSYVEHGGSLYISGTTDSRLAERLLGLKPEGMTPGNSYMAPTAIGQSCFGEEYNAKYPLAFTQKQMLVSNPQAARVLATVTLPYTDPTDCSVFASIHSNPPGVPTDYPAIVEGEYGSGKVLWVAAPLECHPQQAHRTILERLLDRLLTPSLIRTNAPAEVELVLFRDGNALTLNIVNTVDCAKFLLRPFDISVYTGAEVEKAVRLPSGSAIPFEQSNGWATIHIAQAGVFGMLQLSLAPK